VSRGGGAARIVAEVGSGRPGRAFDVVSNGSRDGVHRLRPAMTSNAPTAMQARPGKQKKSVKGTPARIIK